MGRPGEVEDLVERLRIQSQPPCEIVVSAVRESDVGVLTQASDVRLIFGPAGLCAQRNRTLEHLLGRCDVIAFFDDDYLPNVGAIEGLSRLFAENPDVAGAGGYLLADGVNFGGIERAEVFRMLAEYERKAPAAYRVFCDTIALYGCNMAFRAAAIGEDRFDEDLPLYAWQEDFDFSARIAGKGRLVTTDAFAGVHRGVKGARSPGVRLGYSQVANPIYLVRKGTMQASYARKIILGNMLANHARAIRPEPWIDRVGRVRGNWLAMFEAARGRLHPRRILDL